MAEEFKFNGESFTAYPVTYGEEFKTIGGWICRPEPGLFLYSGLGMGDYYSKTGVKVWMPNDKSPRLLAEAEGVRFYFEDSFSGYQRTYLGD